MLIGREPDENHDLGIIGCGCTKIDLGWPWLLSRILSNPNLKVPDGSGCYISATNRHGPSSPDLN
uniref:Uncharacterized protein n=1 Tax=Aegilops tauschii subsp. strangulata TaxID=200361 RepID=A0A453GPD8_AEGTS